jgi:uncharacterized protein
MANEKIPEKINPYRLAEAGVSLHGTFFVKDMLRLSPSLADNSGQVEVDVKFGVDEQGTRFIRGHMETELKLQCQRCMEPYIYAIIGDFLSGVVKSEDEAKRLSEVYDPVLAVDGMLALQDIIEDELIIGLPIVPMHEPKECEVELPKVAAIGTDNGLGGDEHNPFKVIEILRAKNRNKE